MTSATPDSLRVLIVDDDMVSMLVAQHILRNAGHDVVTASGATEALDSLTATEAAIDVPAIDVIVCDYQMPGKSGLDLLESLMESSDAVPPFILLTGIAEADDLADDRVSGVTAFLTKPVESDQLVAAVRAATGTSAAV